MEIKVVRQAPEKMKPKYTDESKLGFGKLFTDHMFTLPYDEGKGWHDPMIGPYSPFSLDPACMCLHYAQLIFEGLKAYRGKNGDIYIFRPTANIKRMNVSARRLCMPAVDEDIFLKAIKELVLLEQDWIPHGVGTSLYVRPTMISTETALGVHASHSYLFYIIASPVGAYYPEGFSPTKIYVVEDYTRTAPGGMGNVKAAGNYAASLFASAVAIEKGYTQVLWLDAVHRKYVEEVGTSNIFFVINDELITPPLGGTILPGVTRDSVIQLAKSWGVQVSERPLSMEDIIEAHRKGTLKEAFASGTAAVVSPIGQLFYRGQEYLVNGGQTGQLTERLYNDILRIQYGELEDPFGWRVKISG